MMGIMIFNLFLKRYWWFIMFRMVVYMFIFMGIVLLPFSKIHYGVFGFLSLSIYLFYVAQLLFILEILSFLYWLSFFIISSLYYFVSVYLAKKFINFKGKKVNMLVKKIWEQLNSYFLGDQKRTRFPYLIGGVTRDNCLSQVLVRLFPVYNKIQTTMALKSKGFKFLVIDVYVQNITVQNMLSTYTYVGSFCLVERFRTRVLLNDYIWGCIDSMNVQGDDVFCFNIRFNDFGLSLINYIKSVEYYVYQDPQLGKSFFQLLYSCSHDVMKDLYNLNNNNEIFYNVEMFDYYVLVSSDVRIGWYVGCLVSSKVLLNWLPNLHFYLFTYLCFDHNTKGDKLRPVTFYICRRYK